MLSLLLHTHVNGMVMDTKTKIENVGAEVSVDETKWKLNPVLFAEAAEKELQTILHEFIQYLCEEKPKR